MTQTRPALAAVALALFACPGGRRLHRTAYARPAAKGRTRHKLMTLEPAEFMRRFLLHVLLAGFHRIRHYGLLANGSRRRNLALARTLLAVTSTKPEEIDARGHCTQLRLPPLRPGVGRRDRLGVHLLHPRLAVSTCAVEFACGTLRRMASPCRCARSRITSCATTGELADAVAITPAPGYAWRTSARIAKAP